MANSPKITERGVDGIAFERTTPASQPGDVFPAGAVMQYAGASAPTGWIICDGSAVSRATYPTLFTNIGTTWGAGDGSTTFNVPDFRDKVPVGVSGTKGLATSGGTETQALTVANMPSHNHGGVTGVDNQDHTHQLWQEYYGSNVGTAIINYQVYPGTGGTPYNTQTSGISNYHNHNIPAEGSGTAHNNMQPYRAIHYIIRAY